MKVGAVQKQNLSGIVNQIKSAPKVNFKEVLQQAKNPTVDMNQTILDMYQKIQSGQKVAPTEVFVCQVKANSYFLKVELASKAAESASGTLKKLQTAQ